VNIETLKPQRHAPPPGWNAQTFEAVTDALAAALVAAYRRADLDALIEQSKVRATS
jgi:hypothetical protein